MSRLRFAVVADSHIRPSGDDVAAYPSNAFMVGRNEYVVDLCNRIAPAFVVHVGDVVHPLPMEEGHEAAVQLAAGVYSGLAPPIHFAPGNHDLGDKPNALVAVPPVADANYATWERYWGPAFHSFGAAGCHFVVVDTPVLNSGLEREEAQRAWLEADLAAASAACSRIFVFTHYPPFIRDPGENEHYDNLGEPARSWLLDLVERYRVEAVFSGHVHTFFYNHYAGADLYVVPATGFVRPDYSELAAVTPDRENGRDDLPKLGLLVVDVTAGGHEVHPVRTFGATPGGDAPPFPPESLVRPGWASPVGVTLRHGWAATVDLPTAGLDEFRRKTVRNDALLAALWEVRIADVRVPLADVAAPEGALRMRHLTRRGMRFTVRSAGVPDRATLETVAALHADLARWEVVIAPADFELLLRRVDDAAMPDTLRLAVAPVVPVGAPASGVHHFVSAGFPPGRDGLLDRWLSLDTAAVFRDVAFRVAPTDSPLPMVANARAQAQAAGRTALVTIDLPRATESEMFADDGAVAERVAKAVAAAAAHPDVAVFLDGFVDHDRGYYPHHALVDRRYNPRPALYRLVAQAAATTVGSS